TADCRSVRRLPASRSPLSARRRRWGSWPPDGSSSRCGWSRRRPFAARRFRSPEQAGTRRVDESEGTGGAMTFTVDGRTAIVTGASSGLGVRFAQVLSEAGANVVLAARREDQLGQVAKEIEANGGTALALKCDIGDPVSVKEMVAAAFDRFGTVDILV